MIRKIPPKENWYILGSGAIGCLWAIQLADAGHSVTLLTRHQSARFTDVTIDLNGTQRQVTCNSTRASAIAAPISATCLLIATKAYDTIAAIGSIEATLYRYSVIILMQNGMGIVEQIRELYPGLPLVIGITNQGAYRVEPFHIVQGGTGHTWLGCLANETVQSSRASVAGLIATAPDRIHWDDNILGRAWIKLGINCVINGLTVTEKIRNGELLNLRYRNRIKRLCDEIALVITGKYQKCTGDELLLQVLQVADATRENISSMRQDALHGRETEVDYLNGFLCAVAASIQVNLPENSKLLEEIRQVLAKPGDN